jgi:hypothetical protein
MRDPAPSSVVPLLACVQRVYPTQAAALGARKRLRRPNHNAPTQSASWLSQNVAARSVRQSAGLIFSRNPRGLLRDNKKHGNALPAFSSRGRCCRLARPRSRSARAAAARPTNAQASDIGERCANQAARSPSNGTRSDASRGLKNSPQIRSAGDRKPSRASLGAGAFVLVADCVRGPRLPRFSSWVYYRSIFSIARAAHSRGWGCGSDSAPRSAGIAAVAAGPI